MRSNEWMHLVCTWTLQRRSKHRWCMILELLLKTPVVLSDTRFEHYKLQYIVYSVVSGRPRITFCELKSLALVDCDHKDLEGLVIGIKGLLRDNGGIQSWTRWSRVLIGIWRCSSLPGCPQLGRTFLLEGSEKEDELVVVSVSWGLKDQPLDADHAGPKYGNVYDVLALHFKAHYIYDKPFNIHICK